MTTKELNQMTQTPYKLLTPAQRQALKPLNTITREFKDMPQADRDDFIQGNLIRLHKKVDGLIELLKNPPGKTPASKR